MKISSTLILFFALYILTFAFGKDGSSFWTSYSFIIEHSLVIGLLLHLKNKCESSASIIILWGEIVRRSELILFNLILIPLPIELYKKAKHLNGVILLVLGTIFFIVIFAKYFDKICIFFNRIQKWIRQ